MNRVQLRHLHLGDVFQKHPARNCPRVRIVGVRAPEIDLSNTDMHSIMMAISGNVYTLERLDSPGERFDITLDALDYVWVPGRGLAFWAIIWLAFLAALLLAGIALL